MMETYNYFSFSSVKIIYILQNLLTFLNDIIDWLIIITFWIILLFYLWGFSTVEVIFLVVYIKGDLLKDGDLAAV